MNTISIYIKTKEMMEELRKIIDSFRDLDLEFTPPQELIRGAYSYLKESKNPDVELQIDYLEDGQFKNVGVLARWSNTEDPRLSEINKLLEFIGNLTQKFPDATVFAILIDHSQHKSTYYCVNYSNNPNLEMCYARVDAFIKKKMNGKPFIVFKKETTKNRGTFVKKLKTELMEIKAEEICTKKSHDIGFQVYVFNRANKKFYVAECGKWPNSWTGVYAEAETLSDLLKNIELAYKERGYHVVQMPKVTE